MPTGRTVALDSYCSADALAQLYYSFLITRGHNKLKLSQDQHIGKLTTTSVTDIDRDAFAKVRGQLLFIAQSSRLDIAYSVAQLCQVQKQSISKAHTKLLNDTIMHLQGKNELALKYSPLDPRSLKLYVFVDSGYNTNHDATSQLDTIVCLVTRKINVTFYTGQTMTRRIEDR